MNKVNNSDIYRIIEEEANHFLNDIRGRFDNYSQAIDFDQSDFQIFFPASSDYFKLKNNENYLEWKIRDYLVSKVLKRLFVLFGYDVYVPQEKRIIHTAYNNNAFGRDYEFAFIIEKKGERVGFRYSHFELSDRDIKRAIKNAKLNKLIVIDFTLRHIYSVGGNSLSGLVDYCTLEEVFTRYFSNECYDLYISKILATVESANSELGLISSPNLINRNTSSYKLELSNYLENYDLNAARYQFFNPRTGVPTERYGDSLSDDDIEIIKERCLNKGLYKSFCGSSNFAKCFITSEYMFNVLKKESGKYFDYSGVALGYLKSVELLLELLMLETLNHPNHELLSIKFNGKNRGDYDPNCFEFIKRVNNRAIKTEYRTKLEHIKFTENNKNGFSLEMMPLAYFIYDNTNDWIISDDGREKVFSYLQNYTQGCRNEHLHKDLIGDTSSINSIRNNTILLIMYLLGSYSMLDDEAAHNVLGIDDSGEYNKLCDKLYSLPRSQYRFYIEFELGNVKKYIRLFNQTKPSFDDNGDFINEIKFVEVMDFGADDFTNFAEDTNANIVCISKDNLPIKVWRYDFRTKGPLLIYSISDD